MSWRVWWRIAWRNLWRNRRRTLITASALAFGYLAAVLMIAISDGLTRQMIENGTELLTGQVQVHAPGYLPERSLYTTLDDSQAGRERILATVASTNGVVAAAPRVYGGGLLSAGDETSAAFLMGIDVAREPRVSRVLAALRTGVAPEPGTRQLAIGTELAHKLNVTVGRQLVVVAPAADGSLGNDLYTVSGIFRTGLPDVDGSFAILPLGVLQQLLALPPAQVHEIAVRIGDPWSAAAVARRLSARLQAAGVAVAVQPWTEFRPELADYAHLASSANGIIVFIVFAMAIFGVANTMLMGTFERRREFAVVRALGTTPPGIIEVVVLEGFALGLISLAAGALITFPVLVWWHHAPPDLSVLFGDFTMVGALVRPVLAVEYSASAPLLSAGALLITTILAALYPAYRAVRVPPADALSGR